MQPRRITVDEGAEQETHRRSARIGRRRRLVGALQQRGLGLAPDQHPALAKLLGLHGAHRRRRRLRGDGLEEALHERDRTLRVDVSRQRQCQVVGGVKGPVERLQVLEAPGLDIRRPAYGGKAVRVRDEGGGLHLLREQAMAVVLDPQPPLGSDHAALALDHLRREGEVRHPIRLQIEHALEGARREPVLVHRHIVAGERIVGTAFGLHQPVELPRRMPARAIEHHVLEEVSEPGGPGHLVAAAGAHPVIERDVGDVAYRPDDHAHPVGERSGTHVLAP